MSIAKNTKRDARNRACNAIKIPSLKFADYYEVHDHIAHQIVKDTLVRLGFAPKKASSMAGSRSGCARQRLEKLDSLL